MDIQSSRVIDEAEKLVLEYKKYENIVQSVGSDIGFKRFVLSFLVVILNVALEILRRTYR